MKCWKTHILVKIKHEQQQKLENPHEQGHLHILEARFMLLNAPTATKNSNAKLQVLLLIHIKTNGGATVLGGQDSLYGGIIK